MACMFGWKWNDATSSCDVDNSTPTTVQQPLDNTLPGDDAWKRFIPQIIAGETSSKFTADVNGTTTVKTLTVRRITKPNSTEGMEVEDKRQ